MGTKLEKRAEVTPSSAASTAEYRHQNLHVNHVVLGIGTSSKCFGKQPGCSAKVDTSQTISMRTYQWSKWSPAAGANQPSNEDLRWSSTSKPRHVATGVPANRCEECQYCPVECMHDLLCIGNSYAIGTAATGWRSFGQDPGTNPTSARCSYGSHAHDYVNLFMVQSPSKHWATPTPMHCCSLQSKITCCANRWLALNEECGIPLGYWQ
jgi:hypothetical protein